MTKLTLENINSDTANELAAIAWELGCGQCEALEYLVTLYRQTPDTTREKVTDILQSGYTDEEVIS